MREPKGFWLRQMLLNKIVKGVSMSLSINDQYWYAFCKANPHISDCMANRAVLEDFAQSSGLLLEGFSAGTYEFCANQIADRLAMVPQTVPEVVQPTTEELRRAENARLRGMTTRELHKEIRDGQKFVPPEIKLEFTAREFKQMDSRVIKSILNFPNGQQRPGMQAAVNKLLRDAALGLGE
jgi:hypothetical protein